MAKGDIAGKRSKPFSDWQEGSRKTRKGSEMVNCCFVKLGVRGEPESMARFGEVVQGIDDKWHLCRTEFLDDCTYEYDPVRDGIYSVILNADWGCDIFMDDADFGKYEDEGLISLPALCRELNLSAEVWGEGAEYSDAGIFFQEHFVIKNDGSVSVRERKVVTPRKDKSGGVFYDGGFERWGNLDLLKKGKTE